MAGERSSMQREYASLLLLILLVVGLLFRTGYRIESGREGILSVYSTSPKVDLSHEALEVFARSRVDGVPLTSLALCRLPNEFFACRPPHETCTNGCSPVDKFAYRKFDFNGANKVVASYYKKQPWRMAHLDVLLNDLGIPKGSTMMIMFANKGFAYLLLNWICSLEKNNVDLDKDKVLILVSDSATSKALTEIGFHVYDAVEYMKSWWKDTGQISDKAAANFGSGAHSRLNVVAQAFANDVLQLGRAVLLMDCDIVWKGNALEAVQRFAVKENRDIVFLLDGRQDGAVLREMQKKDPVHPVYGRMFMNSTEDEHDHQKYNTGFFYVRPTYRGKQIFATAINLLPLMRWRKCDQPQWNAILHHVRFKNLSIGVLPMDQFVPGGAWQSSGAIKGDFKKKFGATYKTFPKDFIMAHASDVGKHTRKVTKFDSVNQWYLTRHCPHYHLCYELGNPNAKQQSCLPQEMASLLVNTPKEDNIT